MKLLGKFRDRSVRASELFQNAAPGGIRERGERSIEDSCPALRNVTLTFSQRRTGALSGLLSDHGPTGRNGTLSFAGLPAIPRKRRKHIRPQCVSRCRCRSRLSHFRQIVIVCCRCLPPAIDEAASKGILAGLNSHMSPPPLFSGHVNGVPHQIARRARDPGAWWRKLPATGLV